MCCFSIQEQRDASMAEVVRAAEQCDRETGAFYSREA